MARGKVRKGRGGRAGEMPNPEKAARARKGTNAQKNVHAGQVIYCENCRRKGAHRIVVEVVKCFDRHVSEGIDFFWVRP